MVNLMLEEFCPITFHLQFRPLPFEILIPNPDAISPGDPYQQIGERETIVPHFEILVADVDDLRIDQRPWLVHFDVNDSHRGTDLRGGNPTSHTEPRLVVTQGLPHVVHDDADS